MQLVELAGKRLPLSKAQSGVTRNVAETELRNAANRPGEGFHKLDPLQMLRSSEGCRDESCATSLFR